MSLPPTELPVLANLFYLKSLHLIYSGTSRPVWFSAGLASKLIHTVTIQFLLCFSFVCLGSHHTGLLSFPHVLFFPASRLTHRYLLCQRVPALSPAPPLFANPCCVLLKGFFLRKSLSWPSSLTRPSAGCNSQNTVSSWLCSTVQNYTVPRGSSPATHKHHWDTKWFVSVRCVCVCVCLTQTDSVAEAGLELRILQFLLPKCREEVPQHHVWQNKGNISILPSHCSHCPAQLRI